MLTLFVEPVDPNEVPDYYEVIKDPIDLSAVAKRLESRNYYITKNIFIADVKRMCQNCFTYNPEGSPYYALGKKMEEIMKQFD
jgi:histone acetyltransferase